MEHAYFRVVGSLERQYATGHHISLHGKPGLCPELANLK